MNILIVSATENEILLFKDFVLKNKSNLQLDKQHIDIDFLITGIGILNTAYSITKKICKKKYNLIINAGIAGAFNSKLKMGSIVNVTQQTFGDFGIDDDNTFKTIFDINLIDKNSYPFESAIINNNYLPPFIKDLQKVSGITVNTVSGSINKINVLNNKFKADIETMESIAVFYICKKENINFIELRTISNYVEKRNKKNWKIDLAIKNLNNYLISIFKNNN